MEKNLKLYIYNGGTAEKAVFPTSISGYEDCEPLLIDSFDYNAKRMGDAPSITATIMYPICLDNIWSTNVYVEFNGEKYFLHHTPTSSKSNTDARYKYDVVFVSERRALNDVYLFDVVSADAKDTVVTNSTRFEFYGTIWDLAQKINQSLENSKVNYSVNIPTDKEVVGYITNDYKAISFSDTYVANALQEFYNTFEVPYYFEGREIHLGNKGEATLTETFEYGAKNALLSISKNNANYKIVNRITGTGSSENIPYYYPNTTPMGFVNFRQLRGGRDDIINRWVTIKNSEKFNARFRLSTKLVYKKYTITNDNIYQKIDEDYKNAKIVKLEGSDKHDTAQAKYEQRFSIASPTTGGSHLIKIVLDDYAWKFLNANSGTIEAQLYYQRGTEGDGVSEDILFGEDGLKGKFRVESRTGVVFKECKGETTFLHADTYQINIIYTFKETNRDKANGIISALRTYNSFRVEVVETIQTNGWFENDKLTTLDAFGINYSLTPLNGDILYAEQDTTKGGKILECKNLMPSIYRESGGAERFYSAENNKHPLPDGQGFYDFANLYNGYNPKEHTINFEDIKPSIKEMTYENQRIDVFKDIAFDENDNNDKVLKEEGSNEYVFKHPYFYIKLHKLGFNLFDRALPQGNMTINVTSGHCAGCAFEIAVDDKLKRNKVQVKDKGELMYDKNGNVLLGNPQDAQNNTIDNEVWIAVKKDSTSFTTESDEFVYPNHSKKIEPKTDDTFVITNILLPNEYIEAAEKRLDEELWAYMWQNNSEKFTFSIKFSRIYLAEHPEILKKLSENSTVQIKYNNTVYSLYVSSFTYKMKNSEALPEIDVELTDTLTIAQNALQNALNEIKMSVISIGQANVLKTGNKYFTRKDIDDTAQGKITFSKGVNIGSHDVVEVNTRKEALDVNYENNVSDTAIPTSAAMIEHGNKCYLSKEKNDIARGNITFLDGMNIGSYTSNMEGGYIDKDGNAEFKTLKLRESLIVPDIKYNRATVFKGIQYLTFGGGEVESVEVLDETHGKMTLKREKGEPLGVEPNDYCVGFWHFLGNSYDSSASSDDRKGNFSIKGFTTIMFQVTDVTEGIVWYELRGTTPSGYTYLTHPIEGLNFACYSNSSYEDKYADRHACKITTTDYEIRLQNLYDWEYSSDNIYRIEGKLDDFSMTAVNDGIRYEQKFEGHGVVFGNAYMYGTLQQFDREVWRISLSYENDNILSGNKKLTATVYRNDVEVSYGTSAGQVTSWKLYRNSVLYKNIGADGTITLSDADIPEGDNDVTFIIKATVLSTGKKADGSNEIHLEQSVTFHRLKQGTEGRGIVGVTEYYAVSNDNTKAPTNWKSPIDGDPMPTTTKDNRYLWNYEKITYNKAGDNGEKIEEKTTPAVIGTHGDDGRGIKNITEYYLVSASDSGVTTATTGWVKTPQKTDPTNKYLWNYEEITYTDKKTETTDPAIIGTYGEKGNDGNDGKDAVQPNYMDGTSVDGTVERNEWKVNTHNIKANPYRIGEGIFDGKNIMTLQPSMFGRKVRISYTAQGYVDNYSLKNNENYIVLSATFKVPWVKGIAQTTADYKKLHAYIGNIIINGKPLNSPVMEIDKVYSNITEITPQYSIDQVRWGTIPMSIANGETLYARIRITVGSEYLDSEGVEVYDNSTGSRVYISEEDVANVSVYSTVSYNSESNKAIVAGKTPAISSWVGHHFFNDGEKNNNIYHKFKFGWTPPSNMTELAMKFRIGAMYSTKERYMTFSEVKAELWDDKRSENTAYIPSENDKARATNVNLLDGTRNGMNSEGKEIWTKSTDNRGTITFGDNLFTLTSDEYDSKLGDCLKLKSPTLKLSGNYTLSFDAKMSNCRAARWLTYNSTNEKTVYETDWMEMSNDWKTHRILLARYDGNFHFRFDSMLSVADGTTSRLYIRNIKLEEGCFGTAWTISENDKGGKPGFSYRPCGTYDPEVLYVANNEVRDAVYYKDKNPNNTGWYICRVSNQGQVPSPNSTYWEKSSYIKFFSVEALFADNLFTNAIKSGSGYFDGLNAKTVKISGELNATSGTFDNVVINGAYNKLVQELTTDNISTFLTNSIAVKTDTNLADGEWEATFNGNGTYMKSWGDIVVIKSFPPNNIYPFIVLPALLPEYSNGNFVYRPIIGKVKEKTETNGDSERNMTVDDVRSLIGRKIIIRNTTGQSVYVTSAFMYMFPEFTQQNGNYIIDNTNDSQYWVTGYGGADGDKANKSWAITQDESLLLECVSVRTWANTSYWEGVAWTGKILRYPLDVQSNS
jgi:hypothetical protein